MIFKDLVVLELASVLAGPLVGSFFAELGAKVYKIENKKTGGDMTRSWKLSEEDSESSISAYYASANYGKESLFLDLKDNDDYDKVIDLVKQSDVVIVNYKPGSAQKLRLDYKSLKHIKSDIIYASLSGYGESEPRPAFDMVLQAETGFMSMTGDADGSPCKIPVAIIDILAAHHLKEAILCAMLEKQKHGTGKFISISLYQAALASLVNQATNYLMVGKVAQRMGSQHPNIAPYGDTFKTSDNEYVMLAVGTDQQFDQLRLLIDIPEERFVSNQERLMQRKELNDILKKAFIEQPLSYWEVQLKEKGIPFSPVMNIADCLSSDEAKECLIESVIEDQYTIRPRTAYI